MHKPIRVGLIAVVTGALFATGAAAVWAAPSGPSGPEGPNSPTAQHPGGRTLNAAVDTAVESRFTPVTPCRLVNTTLTGNKLGANHVGNYHVATTNLSSQGGSSTGCGIPIAATAVTVGVITLHAGGAGLLRFATYGVTPSFSLVSFTKGQSSGQPVVPLNSSGFSVKAVDHSVDLAISVTGYYVKPMFAHVGTGGLLLKSSRVTSVAHATSTSPYDVHFDRDLTNCAANVTPYYFSYSARVELSGTNAQVYIIDNTNDSIVSLEFYLTVTC